MDTLHVTSDGTSTDTEEHPHAPCRAAELYRVTCPRCGRTMRLKTLRYSHVCRRSFDVPERACEQQIAADAAISARMNSLEHAKAHRVSQVVTAAPLVSLKKDYSRLLFF